MPEWKHMIRKSVWYVTHKTELFPIPARPDLVMKRIGMDITCVGKILIRHGIELRGYEFKRAKKAFSNYERKSHVNAD
jgi:hypothetical protein